MTRGQRRPALVLGAACLLACGSDPEDFGRCTGGLGITVSASVEPEFAWTPADCPVNEIAVEDASGSLWSLFYSDPVNRIESPVRYGQAAASGQSQSPGPGPGGPSLTPGTRYVVRLWRIDPDGFIGLAGEQQFHYQPEPLAALLPAFDIVAERRGAVYLEALRQVGAEH